jgi:DinB family protein
MEVWLDRLRNEIEEATRGLSEADWNCAPLGKWSSALIVEHLGRTYGATAKLMERSLASEGAPQVPAATLSQRLTQFWVVSLGRFPAGRQAPSVVVPQGLAGPVALQRALDGLERMKTALAQVEQRWGNRKPIAVHILLGPMSASQWKKFHYVHGQHHILQLRSRLG